MDFTIEVMIGDNKQGFSYQRPVLVEVDESTAMMVIGDAHRKNIEWDSIDSVKKRNEAKKACSFAMK